MQKSIPEQGRINFLKQPEPSFSTRWFQLPSHLVEWGKNDLQVTLLQGDPQAAGKIVIDELEIWVEPK